MMKKVILEQTKKTWDLAKNQDDMPKNPAFQKQLLEEVKPGVKASDLKRKLKRSKSADDIPTSPTSSEKQITQLKEQVKFHTQTAANYLSSLQVSQAKVSELEQKLKTNPPNPLLQEQLAEKQNEIENLRAKLAEKNTELTETKEQLDNSLFARVVAVKQFGKVYDKLQLISKELDDTVEQASEELVKGDDKNSQLRTKLFTAQQQITSLQRDLNLSQRLIELRKDYEPHQESNWDYLQYPLYSLVIVLFTLWLTNHLKKQP